MELNNEKLGNSFFNKFGAILLGAFTVVVGFAWNGAITTGIDNMLKDDDTANFWFKLLYAVVITILVIVIPLIISLIKRKKKV